MILNDHRSHSVSDTRECYRYAEQEMKRKCYKKSGC